LRQTPELIVRSVSTYHETKPVGGPAGQGPFLNAAAVLETTLGPIRLLSVLQEIEARFGRLRLVRWKERTLDLDLLLFGDRCFDTPELTIPHPRMAVRRFVLAPLAEIAPNAVDPWTGRTVRELLKNLDRRPSYLALGGFDEDLVRAVFRGVSAQLGALELSKRRVIGGPSSSSDPIEKRFERFQSLARRLAFSDESVTWIGDRWLLSDFCLPLEALWQQLAYRVEECEIEETKDSTSVLERRCRLELIENLVGRAVQPTFAVLLSGEPSRPDPLTAGVFPMPVLRPDAKGFDRLVDEILAACAGSRS
jgi:2-amino-4-hydroxy-6-hydroxymethyldihydropteridine diphosphokinase